MNKVKLPHNVAEAIQSLSKKWGKKAFLQAEFITTSTHPEAIIINEYFKPFHGGGDDGFEKLVNTLYFGYEVEEIKKIYEGKFD